MAYKDAGTGAVLTYRYPSGGLARVQSEVEPLVFTSRDDSQIVIRTSPTQAVHLSAAEGGWRANYLSSPDLDLACMDDAGRVLLGSDERLTLEGRTVVRTDSNQLGYCDIWGRYILTASFSSSSDQGGVTKVELWTARGAKLWSRSLNTVSVPALLSSTGEAAVLDANGLSILSARGREVRRIAGVVDVQATATGTLVVLLRNGSVKWL